MKHLLVDLDSGAGRILSRFESVFFYRDGIFSIPERIRRLVPESEIVYLHPDPRIESLFARHHRFLSFRNEQEGFDLSGFATKPALSTNAVLTASPGTEERRSWALENLSRLYENRIHFSVNPIQLIDVAPKRIEEDLFLLNRDEFHHDRDIPITGNRQDLWLHKSIEVPPGVIFDTTEGPIVLDRECKLSPFSYVQGPFYAAPGCHLDNVRITGGTILGEGCRVGGEIENSIFGRYSNKHHEGFIGHSLIGNWVNFGALSTTSDLKNNYGSVRLQLPLELFPHRASTFYTLETGLIKFGSIVGDCVKTAIGTMLNTGTVLDAGSSVFGGDPPAYLYPLSWGLTGQVYLPGRFLEDSEKILARRKQTVPDTMKEIVKMISNLR